MTAPRIGWINSYTSASELGDIHRFASRAKLVGYSGLCPRVKQSGAVDARGSSLLLAEGRQPLWVARQLGHSVPVLLSTYAHLINDFEDTIEATRKRRFGCPTQSELRPACVWRPLKRRSRRTP
jgi:Transposase IS116/IS110/IS902 family